MSDLYVEDKVIQGTQLYNCSFGSGPCVALLKPMSEANIIYEILNKCNHPNMLKPLGVWKSSSDETKCYLVFEKVEGPLISKGKEYMFSMEDSSLDGFSAHGFACFRAIFSVVDYINNSYERDIEPSSSEGSLPLLPLKLSSSTIYYTIESSSATVQVVIGDFLQKYPQTLLKKKDQEATVQDVINFNWYKAGEYLKLFSKDAKFNSELEDLATFLTSDGVTYDDLLWRPGIWETNVKLEFIREIYWIMDRQRDEKKTKSLMSTEKGAELKKIKNHLNVSAFLQKFSEEKLEEDSLFDSVVLLRNKILGHFDEGYEFCKGSKDEIGTDNVTALRLLQKDSPEYMINLSQEIRKLKWIIESPVLRDQSNYMAMFYAMEKKKNLKQS